MTVLLDIPFLMKKKPNLALPYQNYTQSPALAVILFMVLRPYINPGLIKAMFWLELENICWSALFKLSVFISGFTKVGWNYFTKLFYRLTKNATFLASKKRITAPPRRSYYRRPARFVSQEKSHLVNIEGKVGEMDILFCDSVDEFVYRVDI